MTRTIDYDLDLGDDISYHVEVECEYQPDEPDVGIVGGWNMESYTVHDEMDREVILNEHNERELLVEIERRLQNMDPYYDCED